jgi:hypothetical protein
MLCQLLVQGFKARLSDSGISLATRTKIRQQPRDALHRRFAPHEPLAPGLDFGMMGT